MAIDFVDVNQSSKYGKLLVQISERLRIVKDEIAIVKGRMEHLNNGTNYAPIATAFGLTADSATGQAALNIFTSALAALDDPSITSLVNRVG